MKHIAVLADLKDLRPSLSLTHVISDQLTILRRSGFEPVLLSRIGKGSVDVPCCKVFGCTPISNGFLSLFSGFSHVFTHDIISLEQNKPWADSLQLIADQTRGVQFFHWVHSVPTHRRDWWDLGRYGANHRLVYPNKTDAQDAAQQFKSVLSQTVVIPHIVDIRTLFEFPFILWRITDQLPGLISADFVQVYPVARDRLKYKGVNELIYTFSQIKKQGRSVCCLIVDSWSGSNPREDKKPYKDKARRCGLESGEFSFVSDLLPPFSGFQRPTLAKLMQLSNVFIFPSLGEAFGLVLAETILASGAYPVPNGDLPMLREVAGGQGYFPKFGSCERSFQAKNQRKFYEDTAKRIIEGVESNPAIAARDFIRKNLNMDTIFQRYYRPILESNNV